MQNFKLQFDSSKLALRQGYLKRTRHDSTKHNAWMPALYAVALTNRVTLNTFTLLRRKCDLVTGKVII